MFSLGTGIFWTVFSSLFSILFLATVIGRIWTRGLPYKSRVAGLFYLSPILGLGTLTIIATVVGKILPLGNNLLIPFIVFVLLLYSFLREKQKTLMIYHASLVGLFGIICGLSILAPLYFYGAVNTNNDSFLYLTHSNWLQLHAFNDKISIAEMTPLKTAVAIFQDQGLRMGGSFLLALFQGLFRMSWSYELYPAILIAAISSCCLAIGFPLAGMLRSLKRGIRLALLSIPALTVGGLVWGANNGFFSQTVGLSFGASLLFFLGPLFNWITTSKPTNLAILKATLPGIVLLVSVTFAYPELDPFIILGLGFSAFLLALRTHTLKKMIICLVFLFGLSAIILNSELMRVYSALRIEAGAVVGAPVEWSLLGYIAHIFGVHAGNEISALKIGLLFLLFALLIVERRSLWSAIKNGKLMPAASVLGIFFLSLLFYRYIVPSPFDKGVGQSWSQFKLSDWAHPCMMLLILAAIAGLQRKVGRVIQNLIVPTIFVYSVVSTVNLSLNSFHFIMNTNYTGVKNLNQFYLDIRKEVFALCPQKASIYLALQGPQHKFRQMMAYYFFDREVKSDWTDDVYIYPVLLPQNRTQKADIGDCVIEPKNGNLLHKGINIGAYRIGVNEKELT
ncbi:MAG: hypothetical protein H0U57_09770 [Tatlockia sp.]|nr:hypothetical protein [Tatlockia sp.]